MHSVGARACVLWCVAALEGPCAYPNVSAKLPSKGKRVRYLGLARARMTRQACSYAFAHEMHAHSQPPVTPSRLAKKMLHIDLCESGRIACCGQHVCAGCTCHGILHSHIPSASTGNECRCVCVCVHACVVYLRALRGGDGWDLSRCSEMPIELFPSWPQYACLAHSFCVLAVADGLRVIDYYGRRGIATSEFACLEAGTTLYYTHMMRALSARTGSKRGRHLPAHNATSAFA
jgi:hypothetical protein